MQHLLTQQSVVRAIGFAALAFAASVVQAGPDDTVDARTAAARSLFTPAHSISAQAAVKPQDAGPTRATEHDVYLEGQRGGTDTHNDMNVNGSVANNTATNVVTGNNTIDAGSFANMSGIPVVIQNTGANVLIQSATIINLQFQ